MAFTWGELRRELQLAGRAVRARGAIVFAASIPVAFLLTFNEPLGSVGAWIFAAGLAGTVLVAAWAMRRYAPEIGRPIGEPPRSRGELLWAGFWTAWPLLAAAVLETFVLRAVDAVLRAFGPVPPSVALAIALAVVAPASILFVVQGWAFSYVAVDGATARDATMGVLRAIIKRDVFVRAVLLTALFVVLGAPSYVGSAVLGHGLSSRIIATVLGTLTTAVAFTYFCAALLTTRPTVPSLLAVPWTAPRRKTSSAGA